MSQTILITGGCGYIGSHVVRQLSEAGYRCIVIDDLSNGNPEALIHNETLIRSDYSDSATLENIFSQFPIAAILHFAAFIVVPESVQNPSAYYDNNFCKSLQLFETARRHGVKKIVFSSTAAVYGTSESQKPRTEMDPLQPTNPYGRSKLMVEWLLQDLAVAHGLRYTILRYFNVAGADPQGRIGQSSKQATHLIKVACQTVLGKRAQLPIFGTDYDTADGTCIRDYIHIEDLAQAHVLALQMLLNGAESEIYNCGYGKGSSVKEVIAAVETVTGKSLPIQNSGRRAGDVSFLVAANTKIVTQLGWKPKFDHLPTIVRASLDWERKL